MSQSQSTLPANFAVSVSPQIQQILLPLCTPLPAAALAGLYQELDAYLQTTRVARERNEFLDIRLAQEIATRLRQILDDYDSYPNEHKALIVGAVRYFVKDDDAEHDLHSVLGLDDDVVVLNYLLDTLGRPGLKIRL